MPTVSTLLPRHARFVGLVALALVFACQNGEAPTAPTSGDLTARSTRFSPEQVRLLASPPGLRWFETHAHGVRIRSEAKAGPAQPPGSKRLISQPTDLGSSLGDLFSSARGIN